MARKKLTGPLGEAIEEDRKLWTDRRYKDPMEGAIAKDLRALKGIPKRKKK
jgi:hypothetical protein